jgi:ComF family protein
VLDRVLDWIYPPRCGLCARFDPLSLCSTCADEFQVQDLAPRELQGSISEVVALYKYESRAAQAVRRLKYSRVTSLVDPLAVLMRSGYDRLELEEFDLIVPIPIHWRRRAMRGFNQAEALASQLPKEKLRIDCLARIKATRPQVGLNREQRIRNMKGAFRATPEVNAKSVLLIDDVTTSGHTAEQCALALLENGATKVGLLTLTGEI